MLEVAYFCNGSFDTEPFVTEDGFVLMVHDLDEAQDAARRTAVSSIQLAVLADQLGIDYWFNTEHHFQPEGVEFNPNPINAQMAIAALTRRIRLGQSANILTWHHPVRLAEQAALLDVISGGRLEFGAGRGYQNRETEVLGGPMGATTQDQERNRSYFEEALDIIIKCWTEPSFSHSGEFFSIPPSFTQWDHPLTQQLFKQPGSVRGVDEVLNIERGTLREITVLPQPVQTPYPQIWMPASTPRSIEFCARRGLNSYMIVSSNKLAKLQLAHFMTESEKAGWPDRNGAGRPFKYGWDSERKRGFGIGRYIHIVDRNVGDREAAIRGLNAEWEYTGAFGLGRAVVDPGEEVPDKITADVMINHKTALIGTADMIVEEILETYKYVGYEDLMLWLHMQFPGLGTNLIAEQLEAFAADVMEPLRKELGGAPDRPDSTVDLTAPALTRAAR
jgi:alkanesulfonate monooxygenase SsuD/methylene tetrahydromethanopterin reductase-like flavin-dependent oxidoreductase (luciferase family)